MSITLRVSGSSLRRSVVQAAAIALAGLACGGAQAQTAPQLLPSTVKLVAGGGTTAIAAGATCPVSGNKSTDAYGDGCLASEIQLVTAGTKIYYGEFPGYAIADSTGAVFFSDGNNGLVRRVDPVTGIVTAIAGGATSNPASGSACTGGTSTDANGDGCLSTAVKLVNPAALAFDAVGNLYVSDIGKEDIRKITATGGLVTNGGVISNVAGQSTYGYNVNNTSTNGPVNAATQSYVDEPFGMSFDAAGNLYFADEGENAIEVINLTGASEVLQGFTIPAGTIEKLMGTKSGVDCPDYVSTSSRGGCSYGTFSDGAVANISPTDSAYGLGVVPGTTAPNAGYVYFANEYPDDIAQINKTNIVNNYAGVIGSALAQPNSKRAVAGSFPIGSPFGVTADVYGNVYITDASAGTIWRVDQGTRSMYVVAGGASTVCTGAADTYGDGCPALQAKFGADPGTNGYVSATAPPAPGIFGISVDASGDLFVGDTETALIREASTGANFGTVGANQPTDNLIIHFAAADGPAAAGAYSLTSGSGNFSLGTATCVTNSDNTTDCTLPVTATPTVLGAFSGTLKVSSTLGAANSFVLQGIYVQSPITRTVVATSATTSCSGTTTYSTTTPITITASLIANGPSSPTGTITFFANGTQIGTPQNVVNIGSSASPIYGATLTNTFAAVGTYTITATYNPGSYFLTSTGKAPTTITSSNPTFSTSLVAYQQNTVTAGQTGLYSFTVAQNVYTGTISFACSGLPANSSCSFSPASITAAGCSTTSTVALSILTQQAVSSSAIGATGGGGLWSALSLATGFALALLVGIRRKRLSLRYGQLCLALALLLVAGGTMACGKATQTSAATPSGTYSITVTATGSTGGASATLTLPLTVK